VEWQKGDWSRASFGLPSPKGPKGKGSQNDEDLASFDPLNIDDFNQDGSGGDEVANVSGIGRGAVVAVDLLRMQPIHGVHFIQEDFLSPQAEPLIRALLEANGNPDAKADIILSDMAANTSGNVIADVERSLEICESVYEFARKTLRGESELGSSRGGVLLVKYFTHPLLQRFRTQTLMPNFREVKSIKPNSSRSESREAYFLCKGWKGLDSS